MGMIAPRVLIISGPNGAGKTTFAREFLVGEGYCPTFFNADLIAAGLSPFAPEKANIKAMRIMLKEIDLCTKARKDVALETTLAGRSYVRWIHDWKQAGYLVKIIYLRLNCIDLAINRVKHRVRLGGHFVPEEVIRRRFVASWDNFRYLYQPLADAWRIFDTSGEAPVLIAEKGW